MKDLLELEIMERVMTLMTLSEKYCEGKETIEEVLEKIEKNDLNISDFNFQMARIEAEVMLKMELFKLKPTLKNKKDILVVAKSVTKSMEEIAKLVEEENNA